MDPLITNGVDPALLRVLEKRGDARDVLPRRKRGGAAPEKIAEEMTGEETGEEESGAGGAGSDFILDNPKHTLDDLA